MVRRKRSESFVPSSAGIIVGGVLLPASDCSCPDRPFSSLKGLTANSFFLTGDLLFFVFCVMACPLKDDQSFGTRIISIHRFILFPSSFSFEATGLNSPKATTESSPGSRRCLCRNRATLMARAEDSSQLVGYLLVSSPII